MKKAGKHPDAILLMKASKGKKFSSSPSPFTRWLAPRVLEAERGSATLEYTIRPGMLNAMHIAHGGVLAAILDDVISATVATFNESHYYTTLHNVIEYFSPVKANDKLIASTRVLKKGRQLLHIECEIWQQDKKRIAARGNSVLIKTAVEK